MSLPIVLAMTGASGAVYAMRLLEILLREGKTVHLLISPSGKAVLKQELGIDINLNQFNPAPLLRPVAEFLPDSSSAPNTANNTLPSLDASKIIYHQHGDFMAPVASGSFLTAGMVVCPCSGATLSGIAHGSSNNLIQRAADVHLKEHRRLILVPRETPLSVIQIENLRKVAEAGAVVLPAMPGWYHGVRCLQDLVDFVVARILDQLGISHDLMRRWGEPPADVASPSL